MNPINKPKGIGSFKPTKGLPPILSPRTTIEPLVQPNILRTLSSSKKTQREKGETFRPVTDNTQKQNTFQTPRRSKTGGLIIRKPLITKKANKIIESEETKVFKYDNPVLRIQKVLQYNLQDETIIKEDVQFKEIMESKFSIMKNASIQSSSESQKLLESSHSSSQFEFSQTPTFKEGQFIGAGSYGQVYLAQENRTGKIYAVKKINLLADFEKDDIKGLQSEIELMKKIKHKNILRHVWNQQVGDQWLVYLEYMSQGTLTQLTEKYGALSESTIRNYSKQILSAIQYLHENNIIHRDIKGANILLGVNGEIKLGDFGCSKIREKSILRSKICGDIINTLKGSIIYMAPEVASQDLNCRASDIWSFGCTVLEMATGKKPWHDFNFDNPLVALFTISQEDVIPTIPEDLNQDLYSFIKMCLQRNHSLRPTAIDLLKHQFIINQ